MSARSVPTLHPLVQHSGSAIELNELNELVDAAAAGRFVTDKRETPELMGEEGTVTS